MSAVIAMGALIATAAPATAHAGLVAASPRAGSGLPTAPGAVVLRFSEPLNRRLSSIRVVVGDGHDGGVGATEAVPGDARAMQRKLGLLRAGIYTVRWVTVSTVDGHALQGSYTFGVGRAVVGNEAVRSNPVDSQGWLGLFGSLAAVVGLGLWAGSVVLAPVAERAGLSTRRARAVRRAGPLLALVGTGMAVLSSALVTRGSVGGVLLGSSSGQYRMVLLAVSAAGVIVSQWRAPSALLVAAALGAEAASGHAAAAPHPQVAMAIIAVHLAAVGVWIFAVVASLLAASGLRRALAAFSPYAVGAAATVLATGVVSAFFEIGEPSELLTSGYGLTLLAKSAAFCAMAAFGWAHNRARHRAPGAPGPVARFLGRMTGTAPVAPPPRLEGPLRMEGGSALVALVLAVVLVGFPNPPREAAAAERLEKTDQAIGDLARRPALSLADASGPFVVGLTVLPPAPGPVELRVQVLGVEAGDGLRAAHVRGTSTDGAAFDAPLRPCGLGCFAGAATIPRAATWTFQPAITSNRGPIVVQVTAPVPTPSGAGELKRAFAAASMLRSARLHEDLRGAVGGPAIDADYAFQAPDAFSLAVNGSDEIDIGTKTYRRETPSSPWTVADTGSAPSWPQGYFSAFWGPGVAARIIGTDTVDGVPSEIVAFVRPELPAWLRVWVGTSDGLVRREEMRAEGHIMNHHYSDFDQPVDLRPPIGAPRP